MLPQIARTPIDPTEGKRIRRAYETFMREQANKSLMRRKRLSRDASGMQKSPSGVRAWKNQENDYKKREAKVFRRGPMKKNTDDVDSMRNNTNDLIDLREPPRNPEHDLRDLEPMFRRRSSVVQQGPIPRDSVVQEGPIPRRVSRRRSSSDPQRRSSFVDVPRRRSSSVDGSRSSVVRLDVPEPIPPPRRSLRFRNNDERLAWYKTMYGDVGEGNDVVVLRNNSQDLVPLNYSFVAAEKKED